MNSRVRDILTILGSGLAGAVALTTAHQTLRRVTWYAPRMDILGARAIKKGMKSLGLRPPRGRRLERSALVGDIIANTVYYALVGSRSSSPILRGAMLGAAAGGGAIGLPPKLGLGRLPRGITLRGKALSIGIYLLGGLAAGAVSRATRRQLVAG